MSPWYEDHDQLIEFAWFHFEPLSAADAKDVIDFFEKPWKWTTEYEAWLKEGDEDAD